MIKQHFEISGMHCVGCTMAVEGAIEDLPGVQSASANYARQVAEVVYDEAKLAAEDIITAVETAGYTASLS
jgi:copper chaperone CopZ